jgi:hypothetical protein
MTGAAARDATGLDLAAGPRIVPRQLLLSRRKSRTSGFGFGLFESFFYHFPPFFVFFAFSAVKKSLTAKNAEIAKEFLISRRSLCSLRSLRLVSTFWIVKNS